jgi:hypothetical protein
MLSAHEFSVGHVSDATAGLTLVLPRRQHDIAFLVAGSDTSKIAVALEGDHRFLSFECSGNTSWSGMIIPNVTVEVDETSVTDSAPLGVLIRTGTTLAIKTKQDGGMGNQNVPVATDLIPCADSLIARFSRWRVVIGDGISKRELKAINTAAKEG